jgi:glycerol-3-phosphate dehydrogenase
VALDAATRGLSVALVEQRDFAAGTSSRSSKLFHGGLRYLEQLELGLVTEALHERNLMLNRLCPHLARAGHVPLPAHPPGLGAALRRGRHRPLRRARRVRRQPPPPPPAPVQAGRPPLVPSLRADALTGAITYSDAQVDDARHTMSLVRTAAHHGAAVAASAQVVDLLRDGERVTGVRVRDVETGDELDIRARQTVNATGVWTDQIQDMAGGAALRVRASKGVHLVVPRDRIHSGAGLICRTPTSVLFVIPWGDFWLVGTTDTDWNLDLAHPAASAADLDYLLGQANRWLEPALTHADIVGRVRRPAPAAVTASPTRPRSSAGSTPCPPSVPGLLSVAGGKYTTYRVMAADAVDAAVGRHGRRRPGVVHRVHPARRRHGLGGDAQPATPPGRGVRPARRPHRPPPGRYGSETPVLLDLFDEDPALRECLPGTDDYLGAEVRFAVSHEGALHLERRAHPPHPPVDRDTRPWRRAAPVAAAIMAGVLGWDDATVAREVDSYGKRVEAERESQQAVDDRTADARRLGAEDVRQGLD